MATGDLPFSRKEWFSIPLKLRQRWWRETEYSTKPPSDELRAEITIYVRKVLGSKA